MRRTETRNIGEVIREFLKEAGLENKMKEASVIGEWENLLGKSVARATGKLYLKEGTLYVYLTSSVVRNELQMLQEDIIKRLNELAGEELIKKIVLR